MAIKQYSTFPKAPAFLEPHHQIFSLISWILIGGILPLCRDIFNVFCCPRQLSQIPVLRSEKCPFLLELLSGPLWHVYRQIQDTQGLIWFCFVLWHINHCRSSNFKSLLYVYIKYMITEHILSITFLNEPELIFYTVKWFYSQPNDQTVVFQIIQFCIDKQFKCQTDLFDP